MFKQGTETTIIGKRNLAGNLLTLSDGSKVEKLVSRARTNPKRIWPAARRVTLLTGSRS
jgi:hypothetical protein